MLESFFKGNCLALQGIFSEDQPQAVSDNKAEVNKNKKETSKIRMDCVHMKMPKVYQETVTAEIAQCF